MASLGKTGSGHNGQSAPQNAVSRASSAQSASYVRAQESEILTLPRFRGSIDGGYRKISVFLLLRAWHGASKLLDFRVWLALHEMSERLELNRKSAKKAGKPLSRKLTPFSVDRVAKKVEATERAVSAALRRLTEAGLVDWSPKSVAFGSNRPKVSPEVQQALDAIPPKRRRQATIPRRLLVWLSKPKHGTRSTIAVALGACIRCLYAKGGEIDSLGRCSLAFVRRVFGVSEPSARRGWNELTDRGWLVEPPPPLRCVGNMVEPRPGFRCVGTLIERRGNKWQKVGSMIAFSELTWRPVASLIAPKAADWRTKRDGRAVAVNLAHHFDTPHTTVQNGAKTTGVVLKLVRGEGRCTTLTPPRTQFDTPLDLDRSPSLREEIPIPRPEPPTPPQENRPAAEAKNGNSTSKSGWKPKSPKEAARYRAQMRKAMEESLAESARADWDARRDQCDAQLANNRRSEEEAQKGPTDSNRGNGAQSRRPQPYSTKRLGHIETGDQVSDWAKEDFERVGNVAGRQGEGFVTHAQHVALSALHHAERIGADSKGGMVRAILEDREAGAGKREAGPAADLQGDFAQHAGNTLLDWETSDNPMPDPVLEEDEPEARFLRDMITLADEDQGAEAIRRDVLGIEQHTKSSLPTREELDQQAKERELRFVVWYRNHEDAPEEELRLAYAQCRADVREIYADADLAQSLSEIMPKVKAAIGMPEPEVIELKSGTRSEEDEQTRPELPEDADVAQATILAV